jgi:GMP synthase-like glutamine amidotransferase
MAFRMMSSPAPLKIALLDLYCEHPNQGMRCLRELVKAQPFPVEWREFDVRSRNQIPSDGYEVYLFSGGPGSPLEADKPWSKDFYGLIDGIFSHNARHPRHPKFAFFICHAFQMVCHHLGVAEVCLRKSPAFGIFPVHKTGVNGRDPVFSALPDPFYAVDSRDWQIVRPSEERLQELGATVTALEKERPHVPYERAVMAIRFSETVVGTQFHPEADVPGMEYYIRQEEKKKQIIEHHGEEKYHSMLDLLNQEDKLLLTHNLVLPSFLRQAHAALRGTS